MPKHTPWRSDVDKFIMILQQSGLILKYRKDSIGYIGESYFDVESGNMEGKKIGLGHFFIPLCFLFPLYLIAFCSFALEKFYLNS